MVIDLAEHAYGLRTEKARRINQILQDLDHRLSLRRIPEGDPAFAAGMKKDPPHVFGVYEEGTRGVTPWVFTIPEMSIDERIIARVAIGDMTKTTPAEKKVWFEKLAAAKRALELKEREEWLAERKEIALTIAKLANERSSFRMKNLQGDDLIFGGDAAPRAARTLISHSGRALG